MRGSSSHPFVLSILLPMSMWSAPCPKCGQYAAQPVGFTWWGGILGPKMLNHVRCGHCGAQYNGRTGGSNDTAIILYVVMGCVLGLVLGLGLVYVSFFM